jgi:methylated-DNA-[protein]-cysteine S-methyltransferase
MITRPRENDLATAIDHVRVPSPIGVLLAYVHDDALCALAFPGEGPRALRGLERRYGGVDIRRTADPGGVVTSLALYFSGDLRALDAIAVDAGGTPFQRRVWTALRRIPAGSVVSYSGLARSLGDPRGVRAVAAANAQNPVPVVVPCHRVIGADGRLVGYGGGLSRKRWLLTHEGATLADVVAPQPHLPFSS